jgi:peptidoglycan/LPS O-acetylase OafA/YrhL
MIYPFFWRLSRRSVALATAVMAGLWLLSFLPSSGILTLFSTIFALMLAWWFGVLLADIYTRRIRVKLAWLAPLTLLLPVLLPLVIPISSLSAPFLTLEDIAWGLGFTGLLALCLAWQNRGGSLRVLEVFKPLGDMSYTLYVIHFPILTLMSGILMSQTRDQVLPQRFDWTIAGILVCLGAAYAAHFFTERPFVKQHGSPPVKIYNTVERDADSVVS